MMQFLSLFMCVCLAVIVIFWKLKSDMTVVDKCLNLSKPKGLLEKKKQMLPCELVAASLDKVEMY